MDAATRTILWEQFGGAIDMLDDALELCPDRLWSARLWDDEEEARYGDYWFVAYHATNWLDLYLTGPKDPGDSGDRRRSLPGCRTSRTRRTTCGSTS